MSAPDMSTTQMPSGGVCEHCGMGTHTDKWGLTACDGCDNPTDRCACEPK